MTTTGRRLTLDTVVYGIGGSAARIISVLFLPIFTRILTPDEFGALDLLITTTVLLGLVSTAGLNTAVLFYYRRTDDVAERRRLVGTALVVATAASVVFAVVGVLVARPIAALVMQDEGYVLAVALTFVALPAGVSSFLVMDLLRVEFRPVAFSVLGIGRTLLAAILGVILVVAADLGVAGILAAQGTLAFLALGVGLWLTRRQWAPALDLRAAARMLSFGLPLVPAGLAYWLMGYSDRFFLAQFRDLSDVGIYAMATRIAQVVQLVAGAFQTAWWPFAYARARDEGHRELFARIFRAYSIGLSLLALAIGLFAREILIVITTPPFVPAYPFVAMLAFALVINGCYQIVSIGLALSERMWHQAWTSAVAAVVNVALNALLIAATGVLGAAISTVVSYFVSTALVYWMAQRNYPIGFDLRAPAIVVVTAVMALSMGLFLDGSLSGSSWSPLVSAAKLAGLVAVVGLAAWVLRLRPSDVLGALRSLRPAGAA